MQPWSFRGARSQKRQKFGHFWTNLATFKRFLASSFSKTSWLHPNTLKTSSVGSSWFFDTPGTHGGLVKDQVQKSIVSQPQWVLRLESYKALFFLFELISNILTFSIFFCNKEDIAKNHDIIKTDSCQFITRTWQKFAFFSS